MRVLYFSRDYTPHDHRFLTALSKTKHEILYLRWERRDPQLEDRPIPGNVEIIPWSAQGANYNSLPTIGMLFEFKRILRRIKPDIVHAGPIQRGAFLTALTGFHPLISTSWGYDLLVDAQRNSMMRWITTYTLSRSDVFVGDCQTIRQIATKFGMPDEHIITFPWGIDLSHFSPKAKSPQNDIITLLSTRSWEPIYGVETIAKAFVLVHQKLPRVHLVMLGNGSLAGKLHQTLSQVGHAKPQSDFQAVRFPGQVRYAQLPNFYHNADIYIAASHSDGSSISLLEAMACGLPVIVSDIPGNREWVREGENGWLFPVGDANALADKIILAIENPALLENMGERNRKIVEQRADWAKNFPKLLQAYKMALNPQ